MTDSGTDKPLLDREATGDKKKDDADPVDPVQKYISELKLGGLENIIGADQLVWPPEQGGKLWEIWRVSPCCGSPCTYAQAGYCFLTFYFYGLISLAKMLAHNAGQKFAMWPHVGCSFCCPLCVLAANRYNMRKRLGVPGTLTGDLVLHVFCAPCAFFQELRAMPTGYWDLHPWEMPVVVVRGATPSIIV